MEATPAICLDQLTKRYGNQTVVRNLNLTVPRGCVFGFLGPNGSGKSTTIKMMTGIISPDEGDAIVMGVSIREHPLVIKQFVGVVPDNLALFEFLTIWEHLDLMRSIYSLSSDDFAQRSSELLRLLELTESAHQIARNCSYGMRKKTSLAMALIHNPSVLVLDEPFEGLDPVMVATVKGALKRAAQRGTTIFLTTHALDVVQGLLDEYAIIRHGVLYAHGSTAALVRDQRTIEDAYLEYFPLEGQPELEWLG